MDGARRRRQEDVVHPLLARGVGEGHHLAEVVGEQVLRSDVVDPPGELEHVAGGERRQHHLPHPGVVVEPVPGLARAPVHLLVRVHHLPVRLPDPGPLDPDVLAPGNVADGVGAEPFGAPDGVGRRHQLEVGGGESRGVDLRHLGLGEDGRVLVAPARRRRLRERRHVDQVRGLVALPGRLELAGEVLQLGALGLEVERRLQRRQRLGPAPLAEQLASATFVDLRLVRGEPRRREVVGLGRLASPVGGEEVGATQPQEGVARRELDGLAEALPGRRRAPRAGGGARPATPGPPRRRSGARAASGRRRWPRRSGRAAARRARRARRRRAGPGTPRPGAGAPPARGTGSRPAPRPAPARPGGRPSPGQSSARGPSLRTASWGLPRRSSSSARARRAMGFPGSARSAASRNSRRRFGSWSSRRAASSCAAGSSGRSSAARLASRAAACSPTSSESFSPRAEARSIGAPSLGGALRPGGPRRELRHQRHDGHRPRGGAGGERRKRGHLRHPGGDGLPPGIGQPHGEGHLALVLGQLHQDPVRALAERDLGHGLVEPRRMVGAVLQDLHPVHPDADGAAGPDPEPGPLLAGHHRDRERVDHRLALRAHGGPDVRDPAPGELGLQRPVSDLARLARVPGREVEPGLRRERAGEPGAPLVVEGTDDPPPPQEPEPLPLHLGPVPASEGLLDAGQVPAGERADLRVGPRIPGEGPVDAPRHGPGRRASARARGSGRAARWRPGRRCGGAARRRNARRPPGTGHRSRARRRASRRRGAPGRGGGG